MLLALETNEDGFFIRKRFIEADYPTHFHDFYEFEYVLSGKGAVLINGVRHNITAGSLIFVTPLDFQSIIVEEKIEVYNVNFSEYWLSKTLSPYLKGAGVVNNIDKHYFDIILSEFENSKICNKMYIRNTLSCILIEFIRGSNDENTSNSNDSFSITQEISHYIRTHFRESINMDILSKKFGYTPNYLSNLFFKEKGLTIKEYTINIRMDYALKKICSTDVSITDICYSCGYSSFSNFLRSFKKKYGMSPKKYRELYQNKNLIHITND